MTELHTDQIVDGRYRILERVGSGGMADVWCAEDLQLGRKVALKLLHRRFAEDAEFVERFRREASAAGGLQHPNVVQVYDRGEHEGAAYIAMEYLEGRSLKRIVIDEAPLEPARAIGLVQQVLRAARFAHKRGIIHRDLKPHNVIVDEEGRAKVTDFGIARAGASDMTQTGSIMGTAQYLSPEQAQGHPVGATSDLYSIGIILYELLTGRIPFEGDSAVTIALKQVNERPLPPRQLNPAVPPALEAVVMRALEKDPALRFADADEFLDALDAAAEGVPPPVAASTQIVAPVATVEEAYYGPAEAPLPVERDRSGWWIAGLVGLLVAAAIILVLLLTGGDKVTVPAVVSAPEAEAKVALSRRGLSSDVARKTSDRPKGTVIGQDPEAGTEVEKGDTVTLTVSDGPGTARVPDLRGDPRSAARRTLQDLGFTVTEREQPDPQIKENRVIATVPGAGEALERGEAVELVVSSGAQRVAVPEVVGSDQEDARGTLEGAGLRVDVEESETDDREPGTVISQDPAAGTRIRQGGTVKITVAKEPQDVEIPNVVGDTQGEAAEALSGAGFSVRTQEREVDSPDQDGVVLEQDRTGRAPRGSRVTIVVGRFDPDLDPDPTGTTPTETTPDGTTPPP